LIKSSCAAVRTRHPVGLRHLPGPHKHIAIALQWDFLDLLADAAGVALNAVARRSRHPSHEAVALDAIVHTGVLPSPANSQC
jgi:hypothetical protein